jgi:hypothetical protein
MEYLPDIKDRIRQCFGLFEKFWPHCKESWQILVRQGTEGSSWSQISDEWDNLFQAGQVETSASTFILQKKQGGLSFAQEVQKTAEYERNTTGEGLRDEAERREVELYPRDLRKGKTTIREQFTSEGIRRMWFFNQMAAVVDVEGAAEIVNNEYHDCTPEDLYKRLQPHYQGELDFVLRIFEAFHDSVVFGQQHFAENDYFDLLIMASVGKSEDWVFVTEERKWLNIGRAAGFSDKIKSIDDLSKATFAKSDHRTFVHFTM